MDKDLIIKNLEKQVSLLNEYFQYASEILNKYHKQSTNQFLSEKKKLESELSSLKSMRDEKEEESTVNYFEVRELTDEEWLAMPKEEILQLYKNCYKLLMENFKSQPVQSVKGEGKSAKEFLKRKRYERNDSMFGGGLYDSLEELLEEYKHSESKDIYPKEFVEWLRLNAYVDPISHYWELINDSDIKDNYTTEKLFNHWSTVVTKR